MKGRWAAGIVPRNFFWILKDELAVSERPGGYAPHHRRVRRQEEIFWLRAQGFTRVVSLLPSGHNLHAYEELQLPSSHFPLPTQGDVAPTLAACYPALLGWLRSGERVLLHHEELGERVSGVVAGFLVWSGILPEPPRAISAVEHLVKRQMGSVGRSIVAAAATLTPLPRAERAQSEVAGSEGHVETAPLDPGAPTATDDGVPQAAAGSPGRAARATAARADKASKTADAGEGVASGRPAASSAKAPAPVVALKPGAAAASKGPRRSPAAKVTPGSEGAASSAKGSAAKTTASTAKAGTKAGATSKTR